MHQEQRQYREGTIGRNMGGYGTDHNQKVQQEYVRQTETIRTIVIE